MHLIELRRSKGQVSWSMEERQIIMSSDVHERDVLNILMDSNLYFELSLQERRMLIKHIVESFRSFPTPLAGNYPLCKEWS